MAEVFQRAASCARPIRVGDGLGLVSDKCEAALGADSQPGAVFGLTSTHASPSANTLFIASCTEHSPPARLFPSPECGNVDATTSRFGEDAQVASGPRIDLALQRMAQWPRLLASAVEGVGVDALREEQLKALIASSMRNDDNILSMAVAFEAGVFRPTDASEPAPIFCIFGQRDEEGSESNPFWDISFDYLHPPSYLPLYREWDWYFTPRQLGRATWSDGYVDEGGGNVPMITYSVPIRLAGVFAGVATMDVQLGESDTVGSVKLAAGSEKDLVTAQGHAAQAVSDPEALSSGVARTLVALDSLEALAAGPRAAAAKLTRALDTAVPHSTEVGHGVEPSKEGSLALAPQANPSHAALRELLMDILASNARVFGSCIAFAEGAYGSASRASFYACKADEPSDEEGDEEEEAGPGFDWAARSTPEAVAGREPAGAGSDPGDSAVAAPAAGTESIAMEPLAYDYTADEWFATPAQRKQDHWSAPYFDEGGGDIWMVTYSVPFFRNGAFAGVVTLDVRYDADVKHWFSQSAPDAEASTTCCVTGLPCSLAYWTTPGRLQPLTLSHAAVEAGMLPAGVLPSQLLHVATGEWQEWWKHCRQPGGPVKYGNLIQLRHAGTGQFLAVRLRGQYTSGAGSTCTVGQQTSLFQLVLEDSSQDPYMEGSSNTWFSLASPDRSPGQLVQWGDTVQLVSHRWGADVRVDLGTAPLRQSALMKVLAPFGASPALLPTALRRVVAASQASQASSASPWMRLGSAVRGQAQAAEAVLVASRHIVATGSEAMVQFLNTSLGAHLPWHTAGTASGAEDGRSFTVMEWRLVPLYTRDAQALACTSPASGLGISHMLGLGHSFAANSLHDATRFAAPASLAWAAAAEGAAASKHILLPAPLEVDDGDGPSGAVEPVSTEPAPEAGQEGLQTALLLHGGAYLLLASDALPSVAGTVFVSATAEVSLAGRTLGQESLYFRAPGPADDTSDAASAMGGRSVEQLTHDNNYLHARCHSSSVWQVQLVAGGCGAVQEDTAFVLYHPASRKFLGVLEQDSPSGLTAALGAPPATPSPLNLQPAARPGELRKWADVESGIPHGSRSITALSLVSSRQAAATFHAVRSQYSTPSAGTPILLHESVFLRHSRPDGSTMWLSTVSHLAVEAEVSALLPALERGAGSVSLQRCRTVASTAESERRLALMHSPDAAIGVFGAGIEAYHADLVARGAQCAETLRRFANVRHFEAAVVPPTAPCASVPGSPEASLSFQGPTLQACVATAARAIGELPPVHVEAALLDTLLPTLLRLLRLLQGHAFTTVECTALLRGAASQQHVAAHALHEAILATASAPQDTATLPPPSQEVLEAGSTAVQQWWTAVVAPGSGSDVQPVVAQSTQQVLQQLHMHDMLVKLVAVLTQDVPPSTSPTQTMGDAGTLLTLPRQGVEQWQQAVWHSSVQRKCALLALHLQYSLTLGNREAAAAGAMHMESLIELLQAPTVPDAPWRKQDSKLTELAARSLQDLLLLYRPALLDIKTSQIEVLIASCLRAENVQLLPNFLGLLSRVVAREVDTESGAFHSVESGHEFMCASDGSDIVPLPRNQWLVVRRLLCASSAHLLRIMLHPASAYWAALKGTVPAQPPSPATPELGRTDSTAVVASGAAASGSLPPDQLRAAFLRSPEGPHGQLEEGGVTTSAVVAFLRLLCRLSVGGVGVITRSLMEKYGKMTFDRLSSLVQDEALAGDLLPLRAQLTHLLRVAFLEPHIIKDRVGLHDSTGACAFATVVPYVSEADDAAALESTQLEHAAPSDAALQRDVFHPAEAGYETSLGNLRPLLPLAHLAAVAQGKPTPPPGDSADSLDLVAEVITMVSRSTDLAGALEGGGSSGGEARRTRHRSASLSLEVLHKVDALPDCPLPALARGQIDALHAFLCTFLARCMPLADKNECAMAVLGVAHALVRRGALGRQQLVDLLPHCITVLDASQEEKQGTGRGRLFSIPSRLLLQAKRAALLLMHRILDTALVWAVQDVVALAADGGERSMRDATRAVALLKKPSGARTAHGPGWFVAVAERFGLREVLLRQTAVEAWPPLLRLAAQLLQRLQHVPLELVGTLRRSMTLPSPAHERLLHGLSRHTTRLRSLMLLERTSHSAAEINGSRLSTVAPMASAVLRSIRQHLQLAVEEVGAADTASLAAGCGLVDVLLSTARIPARQMLAAHKAAHVLGASTAAGRAARGGTVSSRLRGTRVAELLRRAVSKPLPSNFLQRMREAASKDEAPGKGRLSIQAPAHPVVEMLRLVYTGLRELAQASPRVQALLRPHVNYFLLQQGWGLGVLNLVICLAVGSPGTSKHVHHSTVSHMVQRVRSATSTRSRIRLLKVLFALVDNTGNEAAQDMLVRQLCEVEAPQPQLTSSWTAKAAKGPHIGDVQEPAVDLASTRAHPLGLLPYLASPHTLCHFALQVDPLLTACGTEEASPSSRFDMLRRVVSTGSAPGISRSRRNSQVHLAPAQVAAAAAAASASTEPRPARGIDDTLVQGEERSLASFYQHMLRLLVTCSPNRLRYDRGRAVRQREEAGQLIQAAVPMHGIVGALLTVQNFGVKAALLRFFEQVYGVEAGNLPADGTHTARVVAADAGLKFSVSSLENTSIVSVLMADFAVVASVWLHAAYHSDLQQFEALRAAAERHASGTLGTFPPTTAALLRTAKGAFVDGSQLHGDESGGQGGVGGLLAASGRYLFKHALPFLVGYFHSSYTQRMTLYMEGTRAAGQVLFAVLLDIACLLLSSRFLRGGGALAVPFFAAAEVGEGVAPPSRAQHQPLVGPGLQAVQGLSKDAVDALLSCLVHMHDPAGFMRASGVSAVGASAEESHNPYVPHARPSQDTDIQYIIDLLRDFGAQMLQPEGARLPTAPPVPCAPLALPMAEAGHAMARMVHGSRRWRKHATAMYRGMFTAYNQPALEGGPAGALAFRGLRQLITLLSIDAGAANAYFSLTAPDYESIGAAAGSSPRHQMVRHVEHVAAPWLATAPSVFKAYLKLLISHCRTPGGRRRLLTLGVSKLIVGVLCQFGPGDGMDIDSAGAQAVLQQLLKLGALLLEGGYIPAQDALLEEYNAAYSSDLLAALQWLVRSVAHGPSLIHSRRDESCQAPPSAFDLGASQDGGDSASFMASEVARTDTGSDLASLASATAGGDGVGGSGPPRSAGAFSRELRHNMGRWSQMGRALALVQQLCEGHNAQWQNLLREQPQHTVQHNVVQAIADTLADMVCGAGPLWYLIVYYDAWFEPCVIARVLASVLQLLNTLTELTQGPCSGNQLDLAHSRLYESLSWLLDAVLNAYSHSEYPTADAPPTSDFGSWHPLALTALKRGAGDPAALPAKWGRSRLDALTKARPPLAHKCLDEETLGEEGARAWATYTVTVIHDAGSAAIKADEQRMLLTPRAALLLEMQATVLRVLNAQLEGPSSGSFVHGRLAQVLNMEHFPRLLARLLPAARQAAAQAPGIADVDPDLEAQRLSEGKWEASTASLDLAAEYHAFFVRLGLRHGLSPDLDIAHLLAAAAQKLGHGSVVSALSSVAPDEAVPAMTPAFAHPALGERLQHLDTVMEPSTAAFLRMLATHPVQGMLQVTTGRVAHVEVLVEGDLVPFVFRLPPVVLRHRQDRDFKEHQDEVVYSVNRDNAYTRVEGFFNSADQLLFELTANPRLRLSPAVHRIPFLLNTTFYLAILLNILLLLCYSGLSLPGTCAALWPLGVVHAALSTLRCIGILLRRGPGWLDEADQDEEEGKDGAARGIDMGMQVEELQEVDDEAGEAADAALDAMQEAAANQDDMAPPKDAPPQAVPQPATWSLARTGWSCLEGVVGTTAATWLVALWRGSRFWHVMWSMASHPASAFTLLYAALSITAVALNTPALFAFHLFDYVLRSELLRETLAALREYVGSLVATGALWLLLMYAFALFGYSMFPGDFPEGQCGNMADCVAFTLNFGLRAGGGVGDFLSGGEEAQSAGAVRALYDVAFFIVVTIVMASIVTGIIIDSFSAARDHRNEVQENQEGFCFICGLDRSRFDRSGSGFDYHVQHKHNMWAYIYAMAYLRLKVGTEYTGIESYLAAKIQAGDLSFFPVGRATIQPPPGSSK